MRAGLEIKRGSPDAALAVYDAALQPLWPDEMMAGYFKLLEEHGRLREFAGRARTALNSNPIDLNAAARLFHYFRNQNNLPAARRVLLQYRIAKESGRRPWNSDELVILAELFERLPDVNEAARPYYTLYSAPPTGEPQTERALHGLSHLLLTAPGQPIQFGSSDLSFHRDIATADSSPGFLNGILSLLLNWTGPRFEYQRQNEKSAAYFHRAAAERLVRLLEQQFPKSDHRAPLRAELVSAYGAYGDNAEVIREGREYLAAFPAGAARVSVAMQVSDAMARSGRTSEEFALCHQLLRELAARASRVPIGSNPPPPTVPGNRREDLTGARSEDYVRVLDKYLSRLAALHRPLDALRVYRTEIDRNPDDPGLYQRLAGFLEQNGMSREIEDVYTRAIAKFEDRSWYHKLARWHLRQKQSSALAKISQDAITVFSGTELEKYFSEIVSQTHPDAAFYRQLNLYAHERFPEDLVFVHNLLDAHGRKETYDAAAARVWSKAYTALAGQYFDDRSPAIDTAFQGALDTRTIGERLKTPLKSGSIIAGRVWYYYGARYGNYLATGKYAAADDWLPAFLEGTPGDPYAYMALGDFYAAAGQGAKAIAQFESALQLDADRGDAHDHIARVLWSEGRQPEAISY